MVANQAPSPGRLSGEEGRWQGWRPSELGLGGHRTAVSLTHVATEEQFDGSSSHAPAHGGPRHQLT